MNRFRHRLAHLFMTLGLVAWVVGLGARQLHAFESVHAICPEHGELVDVEPSAPQAASATVQISVDPRVDEHGHDCALQAVVTFATVLVQIAPPPGEKRIARSAPNIRSDSARGPPLTYAPKTSPPVT